jgi:hypothetical protein
MIQFKVNGKKVKVPTRYEELSFNEYYEILKSPREVVQKISMFTGIDCETLKKSTIIGLDEVLIALSFLNKPPEMPGFTDKVGKYNIPNSSGKFDIQFESLAQFEDLRAIIKKVKADDLLSIFDAYPKMVAIYLQKIRDGEYDNSKAMQMVEEIKTFPALEVMTLGGFFFIKLLNLLSGTVPSSLPTNQNPKKSKRATKSSRKPSGRTAQSRKRR